MTKQNNSGSGDWGWILILILLATVWPVGLLALFSKLFGSNSKQAASSRVPCSAKAMAMWFEIEVCIMFSTVSLMSMPSSTCRRWL